MLMCREIMNNKIIRISILIIIMVLLFVIFLMPKNYIKEYKINDYNIEEKYNKESKRYSFFITKNDLSYELNINSSYLRDKKIINEVKEYSENDINCIIPVIKDNKLKVIPLCIKDKQNIDYFESGIKIDGYTKNDSENVRSIDDLKIYNTLNKKYFIWKYRNFLYLDDDKNEDINIFSNDYYNIDLVTKINEYLVIPNYDSGYEFKEVYIINTNNLKKETWKLNYEMSLDSFVLGNYKDSIYIIDKKDKIEYELNVKKKEMKIVGTESRGAVYYDKKFINISINKLINDNLKFNYDNDQEFILDDKKLYLKTLHTSILISNQEIDSIVEQTNDYVYYLIKDTLYYYDIFNGNLKIMKNFEWNFNNKNMIFIY